VQSRTIQLLKDPDAFKNDNAICSEEADAKCKSSCDQAIPELEAYRWKFGNWVPLNNALATPCEAACGPCSVRMPGHGPTILVSKDGGNTWSIALTSDFVKGRHPRR
jgi:hypothetical protein